MDRKRLEKVIRSTITYGWLAFLFGSFYYVSTYFPDSIKGSSNGPMGYFVIVWFVVLAVSIFFGAYWPRFIAKVILGERHPIKAVKEDIRQLEDEIEKENFQLHD